MVMKQKKANRERNHFDFGNFDEDFCFDATKCCLCSCCCDGETAFRLLLEDDGGGGGGGHLLLLLFSLQKE